jgi:type II secretory pathway pseudopilin PulG
MIYRGKFHNNLIRTSRGDTIVEVLLAIAIIGSVLGAAYVTSNNNTQINRGSQERLQGIKLAESQLERLKALSSNPSTKDIIFGTSGNFCLTQANTRVPTTNNACKVTGSGDPIPNADHQPQYQISIVPSAGDIGNTPTTSGKLHTITVSWENIRGEGEDNVRYVYGVFR